MLETLIRRYLGELALQRKTMLNSEVSLIANAGICSRGPIYIFFLVYFKFRCVVENKVLQNSLLQCIQEKDFQKTVLPSRLASMTLQSSITSTKMDSQLTKLELANGSNVVAKLVVNAQISVLSSRSNAQESQTDSLPYYENSLQSAFEVC